MARLLGLLAERLGPDGAVGARLHAWPGDMSARGDAVPLRLAAGLNALVIEGRDAGLAAVWGGQATADAALWAAVAAALDRHGDFLLDWLNRAPQTNEVARSAALIVAAHWLAAEVKLPLVLSELGASAGLNLLFDHWRLEVAGVGLGPAGAPVVLRPAWDGPLPPAGRLSVIARAGVDLHPRDPVADRTALTAYVWADQSARLARLSAALDAAARLRPPVARGDAIDWLGERLATPRPGAVHLIYHTVFWQYLPEAARARGAALLARAGARATPQAPLAHLEMEADGTRNGAALHLTLWPGGERQSLGRADFHGRWLRWRPPAAPLAAAAGGR